MLAASTFHTVFGNHGSHVPWDIFIFYTVPTFFESLSQIVTGSFQVSTWFFTTFSVSGMKEKVRYLDNLHQLFTCIKPEQIDIPPFVLEYDARVSSKTHTNIQ